MEQEVNLVLNALANQRRYKDVSFRSSMNRIGAFEASDLSLILSESTSL